MASPTYVGNGGIAYSSSNTVTPTYPTLQADDILILQVVGDNVNTHNQPTGWTKVTQRNQGTQASASWFWKRAVGDESGTLTVTQSSSGDVWAVISSWRGCREIGTPFEQEQENSDKGVNTVSSSSITPTINETRIVCLICVEDDTFTGPLEGGNYATNYEIPDTNANDAELAANSFAQAVAANEPARLGSVLNDNWITFTFALLPALNHYTLPADPNQTFVLSGIATGLLASRRLNAAPQQTYALAGTATGIFKGFHLNAAPQQTFTFTGNLADLIYSGAGGYILDCVLGTFALTGIATGLLVGKKINATPNQTFALSGIDVGLYKSYIMVASPNQTFALSGIATDLLKGNVLDATPNQTFTLSGIDTDFIRRYIVKAYPNQTFALTGITTPILKSNYLNAEPNQTFTLTGITTGFYKGYKLNATPQQTFILTGINVILTYSGGQYFLECDLGTFALSMKDGDLLAGRLLSGDTQTYSLTGIDIGLIGSFKIEAIVDSLTLTGISVDLLKSSKLDATPEQTFALTGIDVGLYYSGVGYTLSCVKGTFVLSGIDVILSKPAHIYRWDGTEWISVDGLRLLS